MLSIIETIQEILRGVIGVEGYQKVFFMPYLSYFTNI